MTTKDNGNDGAGADAGQFSPPTLTITVANVSNFQLRIDGTFPSLDYALNMLYQAHRELEAQWRLARAQQFQVQQMQALEDAKIRQAVARKV